MTEYRSYFIKLIALWILLYLCGSIVSLSFNAFEWGFIRLPLSLIGCGGTFLLLMSWFDNEY